MTILKPKNKNSYWLFFTSLTLLVIIGGVLYISQYNSVANNRYKIKKLEDQITKAEVQNAEIKNELYQNIDPTKLESVAKQYSLVMENNPDYMNINQWVSDSSY